MTKEDSPVSTPQRESERERLSRVFGTLPESIQSAARELAENIPAIKDIVLGDPHKPILSAVRSVRNALRPSER